MSWHLLAAPAAKLVPSVVLCTPLDLTTEAERGSLFAWATQDLHTYRPGMHHGECDSIVASPRLHTQNSTFDMLFSLRQLQKKCHEQQVPLYSAFIDLTKAFELVSRSGLFQLLEKIRCQGCVLAPTLFGIFFSLVLSHAFRTSEDDIYIHTRSDGRLFNLDWLKARSKIRKILIRELLFADDAALTSHPAESLQRIIVRLADACKEFGLTISIKKTNIMGQDVRNAQSINIIEYILEDVQDFTYLGSTITSNLSTDVEINKCISNASSAMSTLTNRVWEKWQDHIPNTEVLKLANMYALLSERRLRWLGHVCRMEDVRIPKDILYSELKIGSRPIGRLTLCFKNVCRCDMNACNINTTSWETTTIERGIWLRVREGVKASEENLDGEETTTKGS